MDELMLGWGTGSDDARLQPVRRSGVHARNARGWSGSSRLSTAGDQSSHNRTRLGDIKSHASSVIYCYDIRSLAHLRASLQQKQRSR